eukprot:TRINITY_DN6626_c0_g1_i2.p1 TRINITY_DN6626_c0_g1~~TRINITY_DN6626_c0_g1_i2.p1  ORF type:complete len:543 (-),score=131.32 TRINITY_DN6626_c0_g1_i2:108-1652(-)
MAAGVLVAEAVAPDYGLDCQDLARISEELRLAVCKIQARIAAERQSLAAERQAAAADRAAAAAERERAERLVCAVERVSERCGASGGGQESSWSASKEAFIAAGDRQSSASLTEQTSSGSVLAAKSGVLVKRPPQRPEQAPSPLNGGYAQPNAVVGPPPMPSRNPPPAMPDRRPPAAQDAAFPASAGTAPRLKAPPAQGRKPAASAAPAITSSTPARVKEPPRRQPEGVAPPSSASAGQGDMSSSPQAPGLDASEVGTGGSELLPGSQTEVPEDATSRDGSGSATKAAEACGVDDFVGEAKGAPAASSHREQSHLNDLDDVDAEEMDDEDEIDEVDVWAAQAPPPPNKVMPPPPKATLLPDTAPLPPPAEGLRTPPEEDREQTASSSQNLAGGSEPSSSPPARPAVKASPSGRAGASSESSSAAAPWPSNPVGKAAASRYKAPPATMQSQSSASSSVGHAEASSSDTRRETAVEASPGTSSAASVPSASAAPSSEQAPSSGVPASRVKAPPSQR